MADEQTGDVEALEVMDPDRARPLFEAGARRSWAVNAPVRAQAL